MPLSTPILTVLISIGGIMALGAGLHSVVPERYWGRKIPAAFLRYLFCGIVGWTCSLLLVCFVPFFNKRANDFVISFEIQSLVGGKFDAYTFVASLWAFLLAALIFIVNGVWRDRREKKREKKRESIMKSRQEEIEEMR